ncbi:HNH endonuclease [Streptoalloteichus hindustanus]|uniref:5-methylcytosine-specific restriction endonuclease McrA n=1 Tax=Streptoalloteichus hindustanus TaxID=2017 RepID=A0A1M5EJ48_STRHI|nr:HNH endonuclease [Streptoalloteichus hindustanus]SHF79288.1 5-methylcytosine-specific restriction endonuclease McrA [Streptoalloteichus hindustanus]
MGVLVLNASYEPLHTVSVRHAIRMLVRQVAVVEEAIEGHTLGDFPVPRVLRLLRYISMRWRYGRAPGWSRRGVLVRDGKRCAYCGRPGDTVDHVLPVSRGGRSEWLNTVCACAPCNGRKRDRTPQEAGMRLLRHPKVPNWQDLVPALTGTA